MNKRALRPWELGRMSASVRRLPAPAVKALCILDDWNIEHIARHAVIPEEVGRALSALTRFF